jgi:hypothetical protein
MLIGMNAGAGKSDRLRREYCNLQDLGHLEGNLIFVFGDAGCLQVCRSII